jgi:hypothetical protein
MLEEDFPQPSTTGAILKNADHFFDRREKDLMAIVGQWLVTAFPACRGDLRRFGFVEFPKQEMKYEQASIELSHSETAAANACGSVMGCARE